jgi:hypothetical protein
VGDESCALKLAILFGVGLAGGSGCWPVLVDESCAGGRALDRVAEFDRGRAVWVPETVSWLVKRRFCIR